MNEVGRVPKARELRQPASERIEMDASIDSPTRPYIVASFTYCRVSRFRDETAVKTALVLRQLERFIALVSAVQVVA